MGHMVEPAAPNTVVSVKPLASRFDSCAVANPSLSRARALSLPRASTSRDGRRRAALLAERARRCLAVYSAAR
eukprot:scaffold7328_cov314-Pinguiococcus_pyrenoidosus.AAC.48